jgi:hypothetical protein
VGVLGEPIPHLITITNHTQVLQEFALVVGQSENFLISGDKQLHFKVHPQTTFHLRHHLIPLALGRLCIPQFEIVPMQSSSSSTTASSTSSSAISSTASSLSTNLHDFLVFKQQRYVFIKPITKPPLPIF